MVLEKMRGLREVVEVQRFRAEQPAFRSWLLFWRREDRSIVPANTAKKGPEDGREGEAVEI